MKQFKSGLDAADFARKHGLSWGGNVFSRGYSVGTSEELRNKSIIDIPTTHSCDKCGTLVSIDETHCEECKVLIREMVEFEHRDDNI